MSVFYNLSIFTAGPNHMTHTGPGQTLGEEAAANPSIIKFN